MLGSQIYLPRCGFCWIDPSCHGLAYERFPCHCVIWSLTTVFSGFIQSVGSLYATLLILGACEARLFPCLNLYLTMVYRREEQAKRVSYLLSCAAILGAVGGLLAYAILHMDGIGGKAGWRLSFSLNVKILGDPLTTP